MPFFDPSDPLLKSVDNPNNFNILLSLALAVTKDSPHPVLLLGAKDDSTEALRAHAVKYGRKLVIVEEDLFRAADLRRKFESERCEVHFASYDSFPLERRSWSVALVDHAAERRAHDAIRLADHSEIVVIHDSENSAEHVYGLSRAWPNFKSKVDVHHRDPAVGAWSSAASVTRDLSSWRGMVFGDFVIVGDGDDVRKDEVGEKFEKWLGEANEKRLEEIS